MLPVYIEDLSWDKGEDFRTLIQVFSIPRSCTLTLLNAEHGTRKSLKLPNK